MEEAFASGEVEFEDGYAPFCKHIFVENFVGARVGAAKITSENEHLLRSGYSKRRLEELAVLTRSPELSDRLLWNSSKVALQR